MPYLFQVQKYFFAVLVAATLSFSLFGCKKEEARVKDCSHTYTKIGDHIFKIPTGTIYSISLGKTRIRTRCGTSVQEPVVAEQVSFRAKIDLPNSMGSYYVQYFVKHRSENILVSNTKLALQEQNKDFSDLPEEDGFYKYIDEKGGGSAHYFANTPSLLGYSGSPLTLSPYSKRTNILWSSTGLLWQSDILVTTRPNDMNDKFPPADSVGVWAEAFPVYLDILEQMHIDTQEK